MICQQSYICPECGRRLPDTAIARSVHQGAHKKKEK